jgi:hypothetical protein
MMIQIEHTGFCLDDYDDDKCQDCPSLGQCLRLYIHDQQQKDVILKIDELDPENNKVGC